MCSKEIMNVPRMNSRSFSDRMENRLKRRDENEEDLLTLQGRRVAGEGSFRETPKWPK